VESTCPANLLTVAKHKIFSTNYTVDTNKT